MTTQRRVLLAIVSICLLALPVGSRATNGPIEIRVLSSRADLISGGDALVEIVLPSSATPTVALDGNDVTSAFALRPNGKFEGLLEGLPLGASTLTATLPDGHGARIALTNHANGGPLFSGPQIQPWVCREKTALDSQCNQPPQYTYFYKPTDPRKKGLHPYDPTKPPADVASTTTDRGVTMPFIIRVERGYQDRDEYKIATLYRPGQGWSAWAPQPQWNHKLLITHGGSCGDDFGSWSAPSVLGYNPPSDLIGPPIDLPKPSFADSVQYALGAGFAVMSTALNNNGHNCNLVVQAESMLMAKERLIEQYGEVRYTIGTGCSGGSLTQQWVANAYPGLYQGILPTCSFPDTWSSATQVMDYHLLRAYLEDRSKWSSGVLWTEPQVAAVEGHVASLNAKLSDEGFFWAAEPTGRCWPLQKTQTYNRATNPGGVRCGIADYAINV